MNRYWIGRHLWSIRDKATDYTHRLLWQYRCYRLNRHVGVYISERAVFVAKTAQLQLQSDGFSSGGKIYISDGVRLSDGVILAPYGGSIHLNENVFVGPYCVLYGHGGVMVGRNTMIAAHTVIVPSSHCFSDAGTLIRDQPLTKRGIVIGEDVWIGCGVRILDGVTIGSGCVVGAGSVVNRSLPARSVAVGVPAKVVATRGSNF